MFETETKIYLIMELFLPVLRWLIFMLRSVTGGELFDSIIARGHYTEADAAKILEKILRAIEYLHSMGIAHRDLKVFHHATSSWIVRSPPNSLRICCFPQQPWIPTSWSAISVSPKYSTTKRWWRRRAAPQDTLVVLCLPHFLINNRSSWGSQSQRIRSRSGSLVVGCHHLYFVRKTPLPLLQFISRLCGYPPFYHENNQELFQQIMRGDYEFDNAHWSDISGQGFTRFASCPLHHSIDCVLYFWHQNAFSWFSARVILDYISVYFSALMLVDGRRLLREAAWPIVIILRCGTRPHHFYSRSFMHPTLLLWVLCAI